MKKSGHQYLDMNNLMIDIETLGRSNTSVIAQIAAVHFDPMTGKTGFSFVQEIDIEDCQRCGLTIDASTVLFWLQQTQEVKRSVFFNSKKGLKNTLLEFWGFLGNDKKNTFLWANSPSFDLEILKNAFRKCGIEEEVWRFQNERDFRTISNLFPDIAENYKYTGEKHNALDDCRNQIAILHKCFERIYKLT